MFLQRLSVDDFIGIIIFKFEWIASIWDRRTGSWARREKLGPSAGLTGLASLSIGTDIQAINGTRATAQRK